MEAVFAITWNPTHCFFFFFPFVFQALRRNLSRDYNLKPKTQHTTERRQPRESLGKQGCSWIVGWSQSAHVWPCPSLGCKSPQTLRQRTELPTHCKEQKLLQIQPEHLIKIRAENNEIIHRKTQNWFLWKRLIKFINFLARLIKQKEIKTQIIKIRNKKVVSLQTLQLLNKYYCNANSNDCYKQLYALSKCSPKWNKWSEYNY